MLGMDAPSFAFKGALHDVLYSAVSAPLLHGHGDLVCCHDHPEVGEKPTEATLMCRGGVM